MRTLTSVAAVALLVTPLAASAQDLPWRVALRLADVSTRDSSSAVAGTSSALSAKPGSGVGVALGYRLTPAWAVDVSLLQTSVDLVAESPEWASFAAADADLLVTTVTLQYHVFTTGRVRPYLGAGAHLASFSGVRLSPALMESGLVAATLDDSASVSVEAGVHVDLGERISIELNAAFHDVATEVELLQSGGSSWSHVRLDVDPWTLAAGVSFRF